MALAEIGVLWIWVILAGVFFLAAASPAMPHALRGLAQSLWELWRVLWSPWSYEKEAEPFRIFIESQLARLLRSGLHAAWFRVGHKGAKQQLTFEKYIRAPGDYGIELVFPNDKWAVHVFSELLAYCDLHDFAYRIETEGGKRPQEVLRVGCERHMPAAVTLADGLWTEVLGLAPDTPRRCSYGPISPFGELIDRPDQAIMSMDEGWRYAHRDQADPPERPGWGPFMGELYALIVFYGLIIATLSAQGEAPEWSLQLTGLTLGGSIESIVLLCLFLCNITVGRLFIRRIDRHPEQGAWPPNPPWLLTAAAAWRWVRRITLPIAVLLVWTGV